jgi:hypothetical protein
MHERGGVREVRCTRCTMHERGGVREVRCTRCTMHERGGVREVRIAPSPPSRASNANAPPGEQGTHLRIETLGLARGDRKWS